MKKTLRVTALAVLALMLASPAWADRTVWKDAVNFLDFKSDGECEVFLPLTGFVLETGGDLVSTGNLGTATELLTTSTAPGWEMDDGVASLVWADGEASPAQITFRVPTYFSSVSGFRVMATDSNSTTANAIDFDVLINKDGQASDTAVTNETSVIGDGGGSVPTVYELTPTGTIAAGDWVTFSFGRDDARTTHPTADLEVKGVSYYGTCTR